MLNSLEMRAKKLKISHSEVTKNQSWNTMFVKAEFRQFPSFMGQFLERKVIFGVK